MSDQEQNKNVQSVLKGRFVIGEVLESNDNYYAYNGFDLKKGKPAYVLEGRNVVFDNVKTQEHLDSIAGQMREMFQKNNRRMLSNIEEAFVDSGIYYVVLLHDQAVENKDAGGQSISELQEKKTESVSGIRNLYKENERIDNHKRKSTKAVAVIIILVIAVAAGMILSSRLKQKNNKDGITEKSGMTAESVDNASMSSGSNSYDYTEITASDELEDLLTEANAHAEKGDYEAAIILLNNNLDDWKNNSEYINLLKTISDRYKTDVINKAEESADLGDLITSILITNRALDILGEDSMLMELNEAYENQYVSEVVEQAETLLLAEDYESAENLIDDAVEKLPEQLLNNATINAERERIAASKPAYLLSVLEPYEVPSWYDDSGLFEMGGQTYTHGFTCMGYGDEPFGNEVYFNLNKEFKRISFSAGIVESNQADRDVRFLFYADGELLYDFSMKSNELPTSHTIDVSGCRQLKISIYDGFWVADGSGTYGLADIMITRDLSENPDDSTSVKTNSNQVYLLNNVTPYEVPAWYDDSGFFKMGGQTYTHGFTCMGYGDKPNGNEIYFNLNKGFTEISFTAGIVKNNQAKRDVDFLFYTDDELIYHFTMKNSELPTTHVIDVTDCSQLKVAVYDGFWVADGSGTYGLADIIATKS